MNYVPTEIIEHILSFIPDISTMSTASAVSKTWYTAALGQPLYYIHAKQSNEKKYFFTSKPLLKTIPKSNNHRETFVSIKKKIHYHLLEFEKTKRRHKRWLNTKKSVYDKLELHTSKFSKFFQTLFSIFLLVSFILRGLSQNPWIIYTFL